MPFLIHSGMMLKPSFRSFYAIRFCAERPSNSPVNQNIDINNPSDLAKAMVEQRDALLRYLAMRRVPEHIREDCFHEGVCHVLEGSYRYDEKETLQKFFQRAVFRVWDRTRKRNSRHYTAPLGEMQKILRSSEDSPQERAMMAETEKAIVAKINALPKLVALAFAYHQQGDFTVKQIAERLGISVQTYYRNIREPLENLQDEITRNLLRVPS